MISVDVYIVNQVVFASGKFCKIDSGCTVDVKNLQVAVCYILCTGYFKVLATV